MSGFTRRYLQDPGLTELLAIEGVVIIDREPAASITGTGSGTVCLVAEFEKGDFLPLEVMGGQDVYNQFGGFGFMYDGIAGQNPCARARHADSALTPEYWNGNGYIALLGKKFSRLILTRVDTSVGSVSFTRLPYLLGNTQLTWLFTAGATLVAAVNGTPHTATFAAAEAELALTGAFPSGFTGGEGLSLTIDEGTDMEVAVNITFTAGDQTQAQVLSRINTAVGYTAIVATGASTQTITGRVAGTGGSIRIGAYSAPVATALGVAIGVTPGTGDVADIRQVTLEEIQGVFATDVVGSIVSRDAAGALLIASDSTTVGSSIEIRTAGSTSSLITTLGLTPDVVVTPASIGVATTLPAGIEVANTAETAMWVTMQDVEVTAANAGPYTVKVRPANDDGTATSALPAAVTKVLAAPSDVGLWAVTNTLALSAALTDAQIDAAYIAAFAKTMNPNSVAKETNIIVCARQSNAVRYALRSNSLDASADGMYGRVAVIRPPLGTSRAVARSNVAQPGVGAYRDQRVIYSYPGGHISVPAIAQVGLAGGVGFTSDGLIDVGSDVWLASVMSQLPPEENPGQDTPYAANLLGIERGNVDVQDMNIYDYRAFKAAGIAALRMDEGKAIWQSGVTSVNPVTHPGLKNIARRRMADYIQDSLAFGLKAFTKKLNLQARRALVIAAIDGFLGGLKLVSKPDSWRIADWKTDYKSGNTAETIAAGMFRAIIKVRTASSMDVIVLDTEIGEGVLIVKDAA